MNNCHVLAIPPSDNVYAVHDTTVIGEEDGTDSSLDNHLGAIWLSPGWVEMSEREEEAPEEHETATTGLLHCGTSSFHDSKPYGWAEGIDFSIDVSDTNKKRNMANKNNKRRRTNPPPPCWGKGGSPV